MKTLKKFLTYIFMLCAAVFVVSNTFMPAFAAAGSPNPFGNFQFFGRSNGADRRRRSNRLHVSKRARRRNRK